MDTLTWNTKQNGQDILDNLSDLKPTLVERYERWLARNPNGVDPDRTPDNRQRRSQEDDRARQAHTRREADDRLRVKEAQNPDRMVAEELEKWKRQREETWRREEEARARATGRVPGPIVTDRRAEATVAPARHTAGVSQAAADYTFSRPPAQRDGHANPQPNLSGVDRHQQQQEEMRRREEEITRRRVEEKRRQEQEGIAKRQQEAENSARAVRHGITVNTGSTIPATSSASSLMPGPSPSSIYQPPTSSSLATTPSSSLYQTPSYPLTTSATSTLRAPTAVASRPPSFLDEFSRSVDAPLIMPLENPTRYEGDSTDSETVNNPYTDWRRAGKHKQVDNSKTPTRAPVRTCVFPFFLSNSLRLIGYLIYCVSSAYGCRPSYPPPTTTTSPPPTEGGRILYPQLMSQHQKTQGYVPSLHSMFTPTTNPAVPSSLLFEPDSKGGSSSTLHHSYNGRPLYSSDMLPQPSIGANPTPAQYPYGMPQAAPHQHPQHHQQHQQHSHSHRHHPPPQQHQQHQQQPQYPGPARPAPPVPAPPVPAPSQGAPVPNVPAPNRSDPDRITLAPNPRNDAVPDLKTVNVPRECLPRFLAIAKVNTAMNRETCGLLLGKDKGHKFVVTTMLIPKQHSTSDTCTMDEEELVLQFTEERSLITLGWVGGPFRWKWMMC